MDAPPDRVDAQILLQIMQVYLSAAVLAARRFWHTLPAGLSLADLDAAHARGSEGRSHVRARSGWSLAGHPWTSSATS